MTIKIIRKKEKESERQTDRQRERKKEVIYLILKLDILKEQNKL